MSPEADGDRIVLVAPEHQPDAFLDQPAPIQNTWYTVLETTMAGCYTWFGRVLVANETLEWRMTIDGEVYTVVLIGAIFGTWYSIYLNAVANALQRSANYYSITWPSGNRLEGRVIKLEMRKTTAAGAGNLQSRVKWCRWP